MNGTITRLILAFVLLSLGVTLLPLLPFEGGASGEETAPLIAALDRSKSLIAYAGFLMGFALLIWPAFFVAAKDRRSWVWATLGANLLLFAAIPLVFTSYISGVSARGLMSVAALCAMTVALPVLLSRFFGARLGARLSIALGVLLLFALPGILVYQASLGWSFPTAWERASPWHWLHRIASLREAPSPWPFVSVACTLWLVVLWPARLGLPDRMSRNSASGMAVVIVLAGLLLSASWWPGPGTSSGSILLGSDSQESEWEIRSLAGGFARAGLRTPLRIRRNRDATGAVDGSSVRIDAGGGVVIVSPPADFLIAPGVGALRLSITGAGEDDGGNQQMPTPFQLAKDEYPLALLAMADHAELQASLEAGARQTASLALSDLPLTDGALEAFDLVAVYEPDYLQQSAALWDAVKRYVSLGGTLWIVTDRTVGASPAPLHSEVRGLGRILRGSARPLAALSFPTLGMRRPRAIDSELVRTFAPPGWQKVDLSSLLLFAVLYHAAFLIVFLLPMILDSRKTMGVYLTSVGFVVIVFAGVSWQVLGSIFLRDNQVYSHSVSLLVMGEGPEPRLVSRQFLCFASMSGEVRDLEFAPGTDLTVYRGRHSPSGIPGGSLDRGAGGVALRGLSLNRFSGKVVVRSDEESAAPFELRRGAGQGFQLIPRKGAPDTLGILDAGCIQEAYLVENGRLIRRFGVASGGEALVSPSGALRFEDAGPCGEDAIPSDLQMYLRRLMGHFSPRFPRYILFSLRGLPRPDDAERYLWSRDLGAALVIPYPD